ncbi:MAG: hypothetical protein WAW86_08730 [Gammaproteobacteria bacterium]
MKHKLLALLIACPIVAFANPNDCPATKTKELPTNTTVFIYQTVKNKKTFYVPFIANVDGKLVPAREILLPTETKIFNLRDNKPMTVHFKNEHDNVDYDVCRSIGQAAGASKSGTSELFATQQIAEQFNFTPDAKDVALFDATITNPCKDKKPHYGKYGVMSCSAETLVATSELNLDKQYWHTKQYRHDLGFAVNVLDKKTNMLTEVVEDCAVCAD